MTRRPPMTARVRRGLATLAELGRSWIEGDSDFDESTGESHSQTLSRAEEADADAATDWVRRGGLARPGDADDDATRTQGT